MGRVEVLERYFGNFELIDLLAKGVGRILRDHERSCGR